MTDVELRPATLDDLPLLSCLARDAKGVWGYEHSWLEAWAGELTITPSDLATLHIVVAHTASDGKAIAGFAALAARERGWTLEHCWIAPRYMRCGVGRALYRDVVKTIERRGGGMLSIVSDPHAVPFYERLGAVRTGDVAAPMPGAPTRALPVLEQLIPAAP